MTNSDPVRVCKRCLLREMDEETYFRDLHEYIMRIDDREKVDDAVYRQRLEICRQCDHLLSGMCLKCGCYVELRAAMKRSRCPKPRPAWNPV